jgi:tetratricopeptide (TPR) repeat protein
MKLSFSGSWRSRSVAHGALALCGAFLLNASVYAQAPAAETAEELELRYADLLRKAGLPEYAEMVLAKTGGGPKAEVLKIQIYLAKGQFAKVKEIIAAKPNQDSEEVWAMKLSLADAFFAWGRYPEAKAIYDSFFAKYAGKPPANITEFYVNSAYRYAQMLTLMGQPKAAAEAYRNAISATPQKHVKRQIQADLGDLLIKMATTADAATKKELLAEVMKVCNELQWVQDIWFGKAIVFQAHALLLQGELQRAMKMVDDYNAELLSIDKALKEEAEKQGEDLSKISPMAECRYLLGVLLQEEATRALSTNNLDKARELLMGRPADKEKKTSGTAGAFQHFLNVFVRYSGTSWAPDAGVHLKQVEKLLKEKLGVAATYEIPKSDLANIERAQWQNARSLFNQQRWEEAADAYLKELNLFQETEVSVVALGDLFRCYLELGTNVANEIYADTVLKHLAERFSGNEKLGSQAGDQLLSLADAYIEHKRPDKADGVYQIFGVYYKAHPSTVRVLMRSGDQKLTAKDLDGARAYYRIIAQNYTNSPLYPDALSRMATCYREGGQPEAEIMALVALVNVLARNEYPGRGLIAAKYRLATGYRDVGGKHLAAAIKLYTELVTVLTGDLTKYQKSPEDAKANTSTLESCMFYKAYMYGRLPAADAAVGNEYKTRAVAGFEEFLARFPQSPLVPSALSQMGTLLMVLQKQSEAKAVFAKLKKEFPASDEVKNSTYTRARILLEMGQVDAALLEFKDMFGPDAGNYSDAQKLSAGYELLKAKQYEVASQAFEQVLKSAKDRAAIERAMAGKGKAMIAMGKYAEGCQTLDAMLKQYTNSGFTVEASFDMAAGYSALGMKEASASNRLDRFNGAKRAMKKAHRYLGTNTAEIARTQLEVARIHLRESQASRQFNEPAAAVAQRNSAIATYQILLMGAEGGGREIRPYLEEGFNECIPLFMDAERWKDAQEECERYLKLYPNGPYAPSVSTWLNKAKGKLATQGGGQ